MLTVDGVTGVLTTLETGVVGRGCVVVAAGAGVLVDVVVIGATGVLEVELVTGTTCRWLDCDALLLDELELELGTSAGTLLDDDGVIIELLLLGKLFDELLELGLELDEWLLDELGLDELELDVPVPRSTMTLSDVWFPLMRTTGSSSTILTWIDSLLIL